MAHDEPPSLKMHRATKQQEDLVKIRKTLGQLQRSTDVIKEYYKVMADLKWSKYQSYRDVGFTPEQSLSLVIGGGKDII